MRKIVSIIMVMIMVLTPMKASAAEYSTYDLSSCNKTSALTISNSTATCRSVFLGSADVSKVKVEQHLQNKSWYGLMLAVGVQLLIVKMQVFV